MRRGLTVYLLFLTWLAVLWLVGLTVFMHDVGRPGEAAIAPADAIVVLTGGSERITAGLDLLLQGKGKKLLISGVYPGLTLDKLLSGQKVPQALRDCCIILGHMAETTFGNAEEARSWMEAEHYQSLRLVTANYHMPRSLLIFRAFLPGITIIPHPVAPEQVKLEDWWERPGTANLLITEYNKYVLARLRLWFG